MQRNSGSSSRGLHGISLAYEFLDVEPTDKYVEPGPSWKVARVGPVGLSILGVCNSAATPGEISAGSEVGRGVGDRCNHDC